MFFLDRFVYGNPIHAMPAMRDAVLACVQNLPGAHIAHSFQGFDEKSQGNSIVFLQEVSHILKYGHTAPLCTKIFEAAEHG